MRVHRILANLRVADLGEAKRFYADFLGLTDVAFDLGWVARVGSPESPAELQLVTRDAEAAEDAVVSVLADDIDAAYDEALRRGYEIVHPLTTESWGVHRFLVRAPDGNVINIVEHSN
jgi:catechol 2,3-dioxygenase-like lactoylglutathione lyase family enzyme